MWTCYHLDKNRNCIDVHPLTTVPANRMSCPKIRTECHDKAMFEVTVQQLMHPAYSGGQKSHINMFQSLLNIRKYISLIIIDICKTIITHNLFTTHIGGQGGNKQIKYICWCLILYKVLAI